MLLVIGLLMLTGESWGGAWTRRPGGYYAEIRAGLLQGDEEFDNEANRVPYAVDSLRTRPADYRNRQVRGYVEYGFLQKLTGIASLAWQVVEATEPAAIHRTWGLSDLRVGARYALSQSSVVTALEGELKLPTGYDMEAFPALGSGDLDFQLVLQAGHSFSAGYATAQAGFNLRSGDLANEIPFALELGLNPAERIQVRGVLRGRGSLASLEPAASADLQRVDARSLDLAGTLVYRLNPGMTIEAGVTQTLAGRNTLIGTEFSAGLAVFR